MTENQIKELYNEEMSASVPDMEALWKKIDSRIDGRNAAETEIHIQQKKKPTFNLWRAGAVMAACAALMIVIPNAVRHSNELSAENSIAENAAAADDSAACEQADSADFNGAVMEDNADAEYEVKETTSSSVPLNYNSISFPDSYLKGVVAEESGDSGNYFVEEDILVETECFIDAIVDDVYASPDGDCVYYELTARSFYGGNDMETYVTVASSSQHELYIGREYIIPVKTTENGLQTVCDSVPQIEVTADRGLVYYNGWKSLDNDVSQSIIYPQNKVDDFFYDRMMFSPSDDITPLIEKWKDIHREE